MEQDRKWKVKSIKNELVYDRSKIIIPYILAVIVLIITMIPVFSNSITQDEAFSVVLIRKPILEMLKSAAADVHPPLYYFMMLCVRFFFGGVESLTAYRFLSSVGTGLNLILLGATMIRKRWGTITACIYILFFGLSYYTIQYTVIVRMYSWGTFFVTLTALLALEFYEKEKTRYIALCGFFTLAAMYTHYYALLTVFLIWVCLLVNTMIRKKSLIKRILISGICITIGYIPWISVFYAQTNKVAQNYWISEYLVSEMVQAPYHMTETSALLGIGWTFQLLVFIILILAIIRKKYIVAICGGIIVGVLVIAAIFSTLIQPIWIVRYFYIMWGLVSLMTAVFIGERYSSLSFIPQSLCMLFLFYYGFFSVKTMLGEEMMHTNIDWWQSFLYQNVDSNAYIMVDDYNERIMMYDYFFPDAHLLMLQMASEEQISDFVQESEGSQLWYLPNYVFATVGENKMESIMLENNYQILDEDAEICHIQYGNMRIRRVKEVDDNE